MTEERLIMPIESCWAASLSVDHPSVWNDMQQRLRGLAQAAIFWTDDYQDSVADLNFLDEVAMEHKLRARRERNG
jgi:hypothetical protein